MTQRDQTIGVCQETIRKMLSKTLHKVDFSGL